MPTYLLFLVAPSNIDVGIDSLATLPLHRCCLKPQYFVLIGRLLMRADMRLGGRMISDCACGTAQRASIHVDRDE